jgi:hypothetical protein
VGSAYSLALGDPVPRRIDAAQLDPLRFLSSRAESGLRVATLAGVARLPLVVGDCRALLTRG